MKKLLLCTVIALGTLPLAGCFYGPYDDRPYDHRYGYYNYDRVGPHGYYRDEDYRDHGGYYYR